MNIIRLKYIKDNDNLVNLVLKKILYIFESNFNLISMSALRKNNYLIKFILNNIKVD